MHLLMENEWNRDQRLVLKNKRKTSQNNADESWYLGRIKINNFS